ncbi:hypothetical protein [Kitasatospora sp. McL0602]|uniref:hypothetical protein n=1 Tax=Kitasatospora sp. McL0602 TaxID=3439530 RepID=UPI003F8BB9FB
MPPLFRPCSGLLLAALTALGTAQPASAQHRPAVITTPHHSAPLHPGYAHGEPVRRWTPPT